MASYTTTSGRTATPLTSELRNDLQDLIQYNIDSCKGLNEAADKVDHEGIASLFRQLASEREPHARELQQLVAAAGKEPKDSGHASAAAHRAWIDLRAAINRGDPYTILIECERGEDVIKNKYEDAMKDAAGAPAHDLLQRQYACVKQAHDKVRDLRDSFKQQ